MKSPDVYSLFHNVVLIVNRFLGWSIHFGKIKITFAAVIVFYFLCVLCLLIFKNAK